MGQTRPVVWTAAPKSIVLAIAGALIGAAAPMPGSTGRAWGRANGIAADGCDGCHGGGSTPTVTLTAAPPNPGVGDPVTLTISISQTNGPVAGFFLDTQGTSRGTFRAIEAGTVASAVGVMHTMPRTGSGGVTTFKAQWTATAATGVNFSVHAISANGDGTNRGDGAGAATLSMVAGCTGTTYYLDQDGDGFGTSDPVYPILEDCTQPPNYAPVSGDCNDFSASVYPGAPELCDNKDNNCNGQIDESVVTQRYCEDKDGDGHGIPTGATKVACAPSPGFGDCNGDCNDVNPAIFPGAVEICDNRDNNCNGQIDEGVRTICGVGACARYAPGCTSSCTPGAPLVETCNLIDDDCDGVTDNGTDAELCGTPGSSCVAGRCVGGMSTVDGGSTGGRPGTGGGAGGAGSTGGASGGGSTPPGSADGSGGAGCSVGGVGGGDAPGPLCLLLGLALALRLTTEGRRGRETGRDGRRRWASRKPRDRPLALDRFRE